MLSSGMLGIWALTWSAAKHLRIPQELGGVVLFALASILCIAVVSVVVRERKSTPKNTVAPPIDSDLAIEGDKLYVRYVPTQSVLSGAKLFATGLEVSRGDKWRPFQISEKLVSTASDDMHPGDKKQKNWPILEQSRLGWSVGNTTVKDPEPGTWRIYFEVRGEVDNEPFIYRGYASFRFYEGRLMLE